jgi:hypothetical protein
LQPAASSLQCSNFMQPVTRAHYRSYILKYHFLIFDRRNWHLFRDRQSHHLKKTGPVSIRLPEDDMPWNGGAHRSQAVRPVISFIARKRSVSSREKNPATSQGWHTRSP